MKTALFAPPLRLTLLLALCFVALLSFSTEPSVGIRFYTGSWENLLAEAQKRDKPIFIDVQTTWCGPCRMMEKQAFPNPNISRKFNSNFVNYRVDLEKGIGLLLSKEFAITAVPTLLFLSPKGELIHRSTGYNDKDGIKALLAEADKALAAAEEPTQLADVEKKYAAGQRDLPFLRTYLTLRAQMGLPNEAVMMACTKRLPQRDWKQTQALALITKNTLTDKAPTFDWLLRYADSIKTDRAKTNSLWLISNAVDRVKTNELMMAKTKADLDRILAFVRRMNHAISGGNITPENMDFLLDGIRMEFYLQTNNQAGYRPIALKKASKWMKKSIASVRAIDDQHVKYLLSQVKNPANKVKFDHEYALKAKAQGLYGQQSGWVAAELNKLVKGYLATMTSPADLKQALMWSDRSVALYPHWGILTDHARLLAKLNRKQEAITVEKQAIGKASLFGESTADYEVILASLQK